VALSFFPNIAQLGASLAKQHKHQSASLCDNST